MDHRWIALIAAFFLALLAGLWWAQRSQGAAQRPDAGAEDRLDTLAAWPPEATRILSEPERQAYMALARALPGFMVLAQVPAARFLAVPKRNSHAEWTRRLGSQCVDLVVCTMDSEVIAVVDIQASTDRSTDRARKRATRMARSFKAAGIPFHLWTEGAVPSVQAIRQTILPTPEALSGVAAPRQTAEALGPAFTTNPFEDTGRDSALDELIEPRGSPASTWYEDFDSTPTPLAATAPKPKPKA